MNNGVATRRANNNNAELLIKMPHHKKHEHHHHHHHPKECCKYKKCCPRLSAGCDLCYCPGDYYINPLCNYPGITGVFGDEYPCILYKDQVDCECIGCKHDCGYFGFCPRTYGGY